MKKFILLITLLSPFLFVMAQNRTITGKVTDEKGNGLSNASIFIRGRNIGTTSGTDGSFSLAIPSNVSTIVVSYVGLADKEVKVTNSSSYNITLEASSKNLQEVVVVGYGTQSKTNVTSSISTVKAAEIENRPYTSMDEELEGKVPGLQAPIATGQPGAFQEIRIRGIGSATAGADPLFVIDGMIVNSGDLTGLTTTANALAGINPNDIESITVLKDAQATSIYGSRGANGVIIITTKKGRPGKTKFRADVEIGYNKLADLPPNARFLNATEYLGLLREGVINAGGSQADADFFAQQYGEGTGVNTDWLHVITRTGRQQQYNLSASGGDTKNQFFISGGYFDQQATVMASDFKRYSFRTNFKHTASDKLNFTVNLTGSNAIQTTPNNGGAFSNPVGSLPFLRPTQNPYNADGSLNISTDPNDPTGFSGGNYNPLYIAKNDKYSTNTTLIQGSVGAEYAILKNLKFSSKFGIDYNTIDEYNFWNQFHGDGVGFGGLLQTNNSRIFNWIATNQFDYSSSFGNTGKIRLDAKLGYEVQKNKGYFVYSAGQGFPPTNQLFYSVNSATPVGAASSGSDYDFAGIYSSATVNYDGRYVLSGSFRRDGSSRFSNSNLYGNFWSAGGAWNINREKFFSNVSFISGLKLRGSYGTSGNAAIGDYQWRPTVHYGVPYGGQPGGSFDVVGNNNLTWETTRQGDIGLDAGFLKDRLSIVVDLYRRISDRLLFNNPLSGTTGFTSFIDNIGKIENKGFEIALNGTPIKTKDFSWNLSFNLSRNKNKIVTLPGGKDITSGNFILREGFDFQTFYVREWASVDPANGDPLWYVDGTHGATTNDYNTAQRQLFGSASPKYFGGLTSILNFKGFDLETDFIYNYGNLVTDSWINYAIDGTYPDLNKYAINLQRWQKPGDITNVPRYEFGSTNNSNAFSSRFLYKGDFIRLRNLTVGYNLSTSVTNRIGIGGLRFYVMGTNLWTKTYDKNLTIDPEQGTASASNLNVFYTKSITFGLNLTF
ncbi:MAG TPA: TonB-dependent receptor [Chitinophagaceae bacterium]|nr:TonB-dependent receptor [Chitinophagaceae bacterium]